MDIEEAYCSEIEAVINIYEAKEEYFSQPAGSRKRLTFYCPDAKCRASHNPLVVGVNYSQLAEDGKKYRQMHFRASPKHPHSDSCILRDENELLSDLDEADEGRHKRAKRPKAADIVDVFHPNTSDREIITRNKRVLVKCTQEDDSGNFVSDEQSLTIRRSNRGITRTSKLERVVNGWSTLDGDTKRRSKITIAGRDMSYYSALVRVENLFPSENGLKIVYGGARVSLFPKAQPKYAYINFFDKCEKFDDVGADRRLTIALSFTRVEKYVGGKLIRELLNESTKRAHYLKVFALGAIKPEVKRGGYLLELGSLDNLVLKVEVSKGS